MAWHHRSVSLIAFTAAVLSFGCAEPNPTPAAVTGELSAPATTTPAQPGERCIDLGSTLFLSGSREFAPGAEKAITLQLGDLPPGTEVRIEVFGEGRRPIPRHGARGEPRLSQLRAKALQSLLESRGLVVREAVGRGRDTVDGRLADRRAEVYIAGR